MCLLIVVRDVFQIKLSHHDGTPVYDDRNPVKVRHGLAYNSAEYEENKYMLPRNGMIPLVFYPPMNATSMSVEVSSVAEDRTN